MSRMAFAILVFVVRKPGAVSKQGLLLTGKVEEGSQNTVLIRHVTVPEAELRLEKALELLLARALASDETIPDRRPGAEGNHGQENPASDGDGR